LSVQEETPERMLETSERPLDPFDPSLDPFERLVALCDPPRDPERPSDRCASPLEKLAIRGVLPAPCVRPSDERRDPPPAPLSDPLRDPERLADPCVWLPPVPPPTPSLGPMFDCGLCVFLLDRPARCDRSFDSFDRLRGSEDRSSLRCDRSLDS
jgi:hypothetical protein